MPTGDSRSSTDPINKIEFGQMMQQIEDIGNAVHRIELILMGDGSGGGMVADYQVTKNRINRMDNTVEKVKGFVYGLAGTGLLGILGFLWGLLTHRIKLSF